MAHDIVPFSGPIALVALMPFFFYLCMSLMVTKLDKEHMYNIVFTYFTVMRLQQLQSRQA